MQNRTIVVYLENGRERTCKGCVLGEDDLFLTIVDSYGTRLRIRRHDILRVIDKRGGGQDE